MLGVRNDWQTPYFIALHHFHYPSIDVRDVGLIPTAPTIYYLHPSSPALEMAASDRKRSMRRIINKWQA